jgi:hypothetical protein
MFKCIACDVMSTDKEKFVTSVYDNVEVTLCIRCENEAVKSQCEEVDSRMRLNAK